MGLCTSKSNDRAQLAAAEAQTQQLRALLGAADARIQQLQTLLASGGTLHAMQPSKVAMPSATMQSDVAPSRDAYANTGAGSMARHTNSMPMQQQRAYQQVASQPMPLPAPYAVPPPVPTPAPQYQPPPAASANAHKRAVSTASVYDDQDLDDDWAALLTDVDTMLIGSGREAMLPVERSIAIRTLVSATATRGVEFALGAAVQDVIRHRGWTAKRQQQQQQQQQQA